MPYVHEVDIDNKGRAINKQSGEVLSSMEPYTFGSSGKSLYWIENGLQHRDLGPAVMHEDGTRYWIIKGVDVTEQVKQWLAENPEIPHWKEWTDEDKVLFRLRFA